MDIGFMRLVAISLALALAGCSADTTGPNQLLTASAPVDGAKKRFDPFSDGDDTTLSQRTVIKNPTLKQVMQPGPLPEMSLGKADAPVTIIKYASLTCPYCRKFQLETFPRIKRQYIDTGKVRFILREFPIGFQSGAATIALRCARPEKYFELYAKFLRYQGRWVSQEVRTEPIFQIARQVGVSRQQYDACRKNQSMIGALKTIKDRGRTLGIIGTPNFFINGRLYKRVLTFKDIQQIVAAELAGGTVVAAGVQDAR